MLSKFKFLSQSSDLMMVLALVTILGVMIVPIHPFILDLSLTTTLALSILILLLAVYSKRPLDFSTFPTVLLIMTLFRLSLNVASTRNILMRTQTDGASAAGEIIRSFGDYVVGGNFAVGIIIFTILVIINFIVITKGAGRVAEVGARFTLDAMPGKQMAIDADLNAGLIDDKEAKRRRAEIGAEADFYGAMDGASKFVRGDAIAGILITFVNIIGGIIIGVGQYGMSFDDASRLYTLLTIGDGLITQIPALIISTAAGIIITRSASDESLGSQVTNQFKVHPKAIYSAAGVLFVFVLIPGLPKFPFIIIGLALTYLGHRIDKKVEEDAKKPEIDEVQDKKMTAENLEDILPIEPVELEVGYGLVNLVDKDQNGDLLERISHLRKQFALDWGVIVPSVRIKDNLELKSGGYVIKIKGIMVASGELMPDHFMAMDPGTVIEKIVGVETIEPVFGLPAVWITEENKDDAGYNGYTVVDLSTVIATHLTEILKHNLHELFGRQELQKIIDRYKEIIPKVIEDLLGMEKLVPFGVILKVVQNLLREGVSVRDMRTILEIIAEHANRTKDPEILTEMVRQALYRTISESIKTVKGDIPIFTLDRKIEEEIANNIVPNEHGQQQVALSPQMTQNILASLNEKMDEATSKGEKMIVLCHPGIRQHFKRVIEKFLSNVVVVSHNELDPKVNIRSMGTIKV